MRRQCVSRLLARRAQQSTYGNFFRRALPVRQSGADDHSWFVNTNFLPAYRDLHTTYVNLNATASTSAVPKIPFEKERIRIHEIFFPSTKRSRIPDATSVLLARPVRAIGLSVAEADEVVDMLASILRRLDKTVIRQDLGLDKDSEGIPGRQEDFEAQENIAAEETFNPVPNDGIPALVKPDFAFKVRANKGKRHEKTSGHRQHHAYKNELAQRHEQINEQLGPYVPHIVASLCRYIQRIPNESLLEKSSEWETVTRWCWSYSFLTSRAQRSVSRMAQGSRPVIKPDDCEGTLDETLLAGPVSDLVQEKQNHARICQSAYEEYLKRMVVQALRVRSTNPSEATSLAEIILESVEKVYEDASNQMSFVRGEALEARSPVQSKTQQSQVSSFRETLRPRLSELLALWTEVSVAFGTKDKPLRSILPAETVDLGILLLARDAYPRRSPIWDTARSQVKSLTGEPSTASNQDQTSHSAVPEEYRLGLMTEALRRSPPVLRSLARNAAHRGQYETVTNLWNLTKGHFRTWRPEDNEESMTTLCTFLEVLLRTLSFGSHVLESQKALAEVFSYFPRPTPLPIYHTLLSVYSGRYNAAMARDLPGPSDRTEGNPMHDNLKATWEKMKAEGVAKDLEAYKIAVMGFGCHGDVEAVRKCWTDLNQDQDCKRMWKERTDGGPEDVFPPVEMLNVFISTFLNSTKVSGAAETATLMFESICDPKSRHRPDIVTINIMLKHYVARGDIEAMSSVMARLTSLKLKPDVFTYTTVVEGLLKSGKREVARDTLDLMESTGIAPSPHTYGLLIGDLARGGTREDMARAEALVKRMRRAKLTPSTVTYTALLGGYFRAGMTAQGSAILRQMEKDGVGMNRVTYNMILRSILTSKEDAPSNHWTLRQAGDRTGGTEAWRSIINAMLGRNIVPNDDTWYILLSGLHRARRFEEADRAIDEMRRQEFRPLAGAALSKLITQIQQRKLARPVTRPRRGR